MHNNSWGTTLVHDFHGFRIHLLSADLHIGVSGEILSLHFANDLLQPAEKLLPLAPDVRCSKCHEINAPNAVWCWSCYATIEAPSLTPHIKEAATNVGIIAILGALTSSGWWPRRARPFVLGVGALGAATMFAWCPLQERFKDFKFELPSRKSRKFAEVEMPVDVLVTQILARAREVGATQIRLHERGNIAVSFEGESRAAMTLPLYVWPALRGRLSELARAGVCEFDSKGEKRRLSAELSVDVGGETLVLRFEQATSGSDSTNQ